MKFGMKMRHVLLILMAGLNLFSCSSSGGGGGGGSAAVGVSTIIKGQAVDAFISGATITAYQINSDGTVGPQIGSPATTDQFGNYSINLGNYTGPVYITSVGGTYVDTATGQTVNLNLPPFNTAPFSAIVPNASGSTTAEITPLTTIAAQAALIFINGGVPIATAAMNANSLISNYFGLANILNTTLLNLTQAGCNTGANQASADASLLLAGISQLASEYGVMTTVLIGDLINDVVADGKFDGEANGVPINVPKSAGGYVALSTIEGTALSNLASAIATFENSSSNTCNAAISQTVLNALTNASILTTPAAPTAVTATAGPGDGEVTVSWQPVPGALTYNIYMATSSSVQETPTGLSGYRSVLGVISANDTISGLTDGTTYYFVVTANSGAGGLGIESAISSPAVSATPRATGNFTIGGTVTGSSLSGPLVLQDTVSGNNITITQLGSFTSSFTLANGTRYNVIVYNPPIGQTCVVNSGGTGTISNGNITNISVSCTTNPGEFTIGGFASGIITGDQIMLELIANGTNNLTVTTLGKFAFGNFLTSGTAYTVTINTASDQYNTLPGQTCYIINGAGIVGSSEVTNVELDCSSSLLTEYAASGSNNTTLPAPGGITVDSSGNIWYTEFSANQVIEMTPPYSVTNVTTYTVSGGPQGITVGPDGSTIWFAESLVNKIGRISNGNLLECPVKTSSNSPGPMNIAAPSDGNIWFTAFNSNQIGWFIANTFTGCSFTVDSLNVPTHNSLVPEPLGITSDAQGNIWFTENNTPYIGVIPYGSILLTEYPILANAGNPYLSGITPGPDGNIWFTESLGQKVGFITTGATSGTGNVTVYSLPTPDAYPTYITTGNDGNLWFTESFGNKIGKITTEGVVTDFLLPNYGSYPTGITAWPPSSATGNTGVTPGVWFTETYGNRIGNLAFP